MPPDNLMSDGITSAEGRLLAVQMGALRDDVKEVKETMREMARSLEQLVRIEEQQKDMRSAIGRAFDEMKAERVKREELETRVAVVEKSMPGMNEMRKWLIGGVTSGIALLLAAVSYYIKNHLN